MHAEKILRLNRLILRNAIRGNPRYTYLQDVSRMFFDFSNCDAIEILHKDGDLSYRWTSTKNHEPLFRFEILPGTADTPLAESISSATFLERLYRLILSGNYRADPPGSTAQGSFWTNDLTNLPDKIIQAMGINAEADKKEWGDYRSLAILPFASDPDNTGLLILKNLKPGFFTRYEIGYYEGIAQTFGLAAADRRAQHALRERVKELTCLYGIARIAEKEELPLEDKLRQIVALLPQAWQYPDIAVARIKFDDLNIDTANFCESRYRQAAEVNISSVKRGMVEVCYVGEKPELEKNPFLVEETSLIDEVARRVGEIIESTEAERDKMKLQAQLRHADRLATIGQLAAGIAHEINEPLGSILGFTQLAQKGLENLQGSVPMENLSHDLEKIEKASLQARNIIRNMLIFARQMPSKKSFISLNRIIEETLSFFTPRCHNQGIEVINEMSETVPDLEADPSQLSQLLVNLVVNAIQAMPNGGRLTIRTDYDEKNIILSVADTGMGMSDEVRKRIFDPFFTTKDVKQGTGLGLSVVHGIVTGHGGSIEVESDVGCGSCFKVRLPTGNGKMSEKVRK